MTKGSTLLFGNIIQVVAKDRKTSLSLNPVCTETTYLLDHLPQRNHPASWNASIVIKCEIDINKDFFSLFFSTVIYVAVLTFLPELPIQLQSSLTYSQPSVVYSFSDMPLNSISFIFASCPNSFKWDLNGHIGSKMLPLRQKEMLWPSWFIVVE